MRPAAPRARRVLHLVDRAGPGAARAGGATDAALAALGTLLTRVRRDEHDVVLIGHDGLERRAAMLGVHTTDRVSPALGLARLAARGLRRWVRDRGKPDVVHAWSGPAAALARTALGRAVPLVLTRLGGEAPAADAPGRRRQDQPILLTVGGEAAPAGMRSVAAAPPVEAPPASERERRRAAMGLRPTEAVVALLGAGAEADATRFTFVLGLVRRAGGACTGLVPRDAMRLAAAQRVHRAIDAASRLMIAEAPMPALLAAADVALWTCAGGAGAAATYWIAAAHAAGVPAVAPAGAGAAWPHEGAAALLALNATPPELARVLAPLVADAALRTRMARAAGDTIMRCRPAEAFAAAAERAYALAVDELAAAPAVRSGPATAAAIGGPTE